MKKVHYLLELARLIKVEKKENMFTRFKKQNKWE